MALKPLTDEAKGPISSPSDADCASLLVHYLRNFPFMGVIHVTDRSGQRHTLEAIEGWRVMEIIRDWGLPIEGLCGGACECATCHVFVAEEWIPKIYPPTEEEEDQLDTVVTQPTSRLSCQILWTPDLDGLEVTLAPTGG